MIRLKVLSGHNAGAEAVLQPGRDYLVGSDEESCDLVLAARDVAARHILIRTIDDAAASMEVLQGCAVDAAGQALAEGWHELVLPARVSLGSVQLMLDLPEAVNGEPAPRIEDGDDRPASMPSSSRGRLAAGGLAAVLGIAALVGAQAALWDPHADRDDMASVRQRLASLGSPGLAPLRLWQDGAGRPVLSGYAAKPEEVQRTRAILDNAGLHRVALRLTVRGTTRQFDDALPPAGPARHLADGGLLIEQAASAARSASTAASAAAPSPIRLRSWRAGREGYIETVAGERYAIGDALPGQYVLAEIHPQSIGIRRNDGAVVSIPLN